MAYSALFVSRRHDANVAQPPQLAFQRRQSRSVDSIIIRQENPHDSLFLFRRA
jgi:hypothetical protein